MQTGEWYPAAYRRLYTTYWALADGFQAMLQVMWRGMCVYGVVGVESVCRRVQWQEIQDQEAYRFAQIVSPIIPHH